MDTLCYTYNLPKPFRNRPGVAISVVHMEALATMDLFFSIRSIRTEDFNAVDFLIRTQWKYTRWLKLELRFLAEDLTAIEANNFNIDTSSLVGCKQQK